MPEVKESNVDVLIIGAGPAGLIATIWMSRLGIKARTVDKRSTRVFNGQADGLQPRTMEIFDSFGFAYKIIEAASEFHEMISWAPNEETGALERKSRVRFPPMSNFTQHVLNQGTIEKTILESISENPDVAIERGVLPSALFIDESKAQDANAYPVRVTLQHLSEEDAQPHQCKAHMKNGEVVDGLFRSNLTGDDSVDLIEKAVSKGEYSEVVNAKYVLGCDGAHSWTRQQLGFEMKGDSTDYIWGVIDIIPISNFPDLRRPGTVQSERGSILIIPRENKLVRFYTQLHEVKPDETGYVDRSKVTPEVILKTAQKIMAPYTLDYTYCDWWTAYQVGQRVGTGFCDSNHRVFLGGDAVHTHSPKAGQGLNVSMQDMNNLAWKIGGVLNGWLPRDVLETYQPERRKFAHELIELDHKLSRLFSGTPTRDELANMYQKNAVFIAGYGVHYAPSTLVAPPNDSSIDTPVDPLRDASGTPVRQSQAQAKPHFAKNLPLGEVMRHAGIVTHSDSGSWNVKSSLKSDGRWRLFVFPGNIADEARMRKFNELGDRMTAPGGLLSRYTVERRRSSTTGGPPTKKESLVDVITIHTAGIEDVETTAFHKAFFPFDDYEGYDYEKVFTGIAMEGKSTGQAYESYGIDPEVGAMVVTRPDQYIAFITGLDGIEDVETFFDGVLLRQDGEALSMNWSSLGNGAHVNGSAKAVAA